MYKRVCICMYININNDYYYILFVINLQYILTGTGEAPCVATVVL